MHSFHEHAFHAFIVLSENKMSHISKGFEVVVVVVVCVAVFFFSGFLFVSVWGFLCVFFSQWSHWPFSYNK